VPEWRRGDLLGPGRTAALLNWSAHPRWKVIAGAELGAVYGRADSGAMVAVALLGCFLFGACRRSKGQPAALDSTALSAQAPSAATADTGKKVLGDLSAAGLKDLASTMDARTATEALNKSGLAKADARDYAGAIGDFTKAIQRHPANCDSLFAADSPTARSESCAALYYNRGQSRFASGQYGAAKDDFSHANRLNPNLKDAQRMWQEASVAELKGQGFSEAKNGCDALTGQWNWFTGGVVTLTSKHAILYDGRASGRWECTDEEQGAATLRWANGFVDRITVSGDGITGVNEQNVPISATRKN
jgi:hypothetical protein